MLCASTAPPIIAATAAPALAIAFWRTGAAAALLFPISLVRGELRRIGSPWLAVLAGAALAAHFGTFIPSLQYTSVASASALVCSQAVWAGILGRLLGERLPRRAWVGTAICLLGVLMVTGVDVSLSVRALGGDALALVAGVFGGVYIVTGGFVRRDTSTLAYTQLCYGACGLLLLAACLIAGRPLTGYAHGCATVQKSDYAQLAGVPVALLGVVGYVAILASLIRDTETTRTAAAFLSIGGLAFSGWLTYVEVFELDAICIWCVGSAICMALLAVITTARMLRSPPPVPVRAR